MFCVRCGNAVNENEFFCNMCGTKINQSVESINKNYFDSERRLSVIEYSELINKLAFNLQEFEISNNEYIKNEKRYKDIEKSIVPNRRAKRILIPLGIAFVYFLLSGTFIFKYNLLHAIICIFTTFSVWLGTLLILIFVVKDPSKGTAKIINECKKKMEETGLFSKYTMHELLDELDVIECFTEPGKAPIQGEVLKKQEQIYRDLGVMPLLATPQK